MLLDSLNVILSVDAVMISLHSCDFHWLPLTSYWMTAADVILVNSWPVYLRWLEMYWHHSGNFFFGLASFVERTVSLFLSSLSLLSFHFHVISFELHWFSLTFLLPHLLFSFQLLMLVSFFPDPLFLALVKRRLKKSLWYPFSGLEWSFPPTRLFLFFSLFMKEKLLLCRKFPSLDMTCSCCWDSSKFHSLEKKSHSSSSSLTIPFLSFSS